MCISDRLKQILEVKGMSIKEFSELTGISYRSVMNYLNEGRDPSSEALIKIHNGVGIDINWLLIGSGKMFFSEDKKNALSIQEDELILNYRDMSDNLKRTLFSLIKEIKTQVNLNEVENGNP